jgi:hypothetical protein
VIEPTDIERSLRADADAGLDRVGLRITTYPARTPSQFPHSAPAGGAMSATPHKARGRPSTEANAMRDRNVTFPMPWRLAGACSAALGCVVALLFANFVAAATLCVAAVALGAAAADF